MPSSSSLRIVAAIEALKGCVVLATGTGLLLLVHRDVHQLALQLVAHTHLNPAARYPAIFLDAANHLTDMRILLLALGAATYSALRLLEAYGLFLGKGWAEILAAGSGAIYVPVELYELLRHPSWLSVGSLLLNLIIVAIMLRALQRRRAGQGANTA